MIVKTYGIDEIWQRYHAHFVVELDDFHGCGRPIAFRLSPLKPIALFAMGDGWLIDGTAQGKSLTEEQYRRMLRVCAKCITHIREWDQSDDGTLIERWTPVRVVIGRDPDPDAKDCKELSAEFIDFNTTLSLLTQELIRNFQLHWESRKNGGSGIQQEGPGGRGSNGGEVPHTPARVGVRGAGRARS